MPNLLLMCTIEKLLHQMMLYHCFTTATHTWTICWSIKSCNFRCYSFYFFANVVDAVVAGFVLAVLRSELLDVICLVLTSTILFIGSFIISLDISVFLFLHHLIFYFICYFFSPSTPFCIILSCFVPEPVDTSLVIVSYGILLPQLLFFNYLFIVF